MTNGQHSMGADMKKSTSYANSRVIHTVNPARTLCAFPSVYCRSRIRFAYGSDSARIDTLIIIPIKRTPLQNPVLVVPHIPHRTLHQRVNTHNIQLYLVHHTRGFKNLLSCKFNGQNKPSRTWKMLRLLWAKIKERIFQITLPLASVQLLYWTFKHHTSFQTK